ncbi:hypothetical protein [Photobacterium angustum]|uniref:Lipoprotein n=1 Tax=Photobacterium angustum TaxID=661 RepID=A0A2S7VKE7_PHOAN|nr:hypothetical protein [Photobacterium angustum]PQJ62637.1 hypothetical protein BTO08_20645 [Photobacterium angustum]
MNKLVIVFSVLLSLLGCGSDENNIIGYWQQRDNDENFLQISKNGNDYILTKYSVSSWHKSIFIEKEYPAEIQGNTVKTGELIGLNAFYKESEKELILNGSKKYIKVAAEKALEKIDKLKNQS